MTVSSIQPVLDPVQALAVWPRLEIAGHKYRRGHVMVVSAGLEGSGAARLAARAALRIGSGLVTVASPPDCLAVHAVAQTAVMVRQFEGPAGLAALLADERRNAIAIGPGLEPAAETRDLVRVALSAQRLVVLDAGGLSAFAGDSDSLAIAIRRAGSPVVVTPHEGEFKRLLPLLSGDRPSRAMAAAAFLGCVVVLKGPGTVIAEPSGRVAIDRLAPPTLATAGTGDVLTGFIAGLLAQGMPPFEAACAGVWMHGAAALEFGPGLIAEDLEASVPAVMARYGLQATV
jgi:hydroxyethylthiazole kinase-like uncharacterized protein yjeF